MSRTLIRDKEKPLQFEAIAPDEVRIRARATQSSGLTSSLARNLDTKPSISARTGKAATALMQKRSVVFQVSYASLFVPLKWCYKVTGGFDISFAATAHNFSISRRIFSYCWVACQESSFAQRSFSSVNVRVST